jgi:hypothetical protein
MLLSALSSFIGRSIFPCWRTLYIHYCIQYAAIPIVFPCDIYGHTSSSCVVFALYISPIFSKVQMCNSQLFLDLFLLLLLPAALSYTFVTSYSHLVCFHHKEIIKPQPQHSNISR